MAVMEGKHPLEALRADRNRRRMKPADYARFLGELPSTVHRWETGARKIGETKLNSVSEKTGIPKRELRPDLADLVSEAAE